ncbi:MAG: hypothetical protein EXR69_15345 [Myxococcales bacterium]|nr:hypothetical protein [Myxococcales bacterium]
MSGQISRFTRDTLVRHVFGWGRAGLWAFVIACSGCAGLNATETCGAYRYGVLEFASKHLSPDALMRDAVIDACEACPEYILNGNASVLRAEKHGAMAACQAAEGGDAECEEWANVIALGAVNEDWVPWSECASL